MAFVTFAFVGLVMAAWWVASGWAAWSETSQQEMLAASPTPSTDVTKVNAELETAFGLRTLAGDPEEEQTTVYKAAAWSVGDEFV